MVGPGFAASWLQCNQPRRGKRDEREKECSARQYIKMSEETNGGGIPVMCSAVVIMEKQSYL